MHSRLLFVGFAVAAFVVVPSRDAFACSDAGPGPCGISVFPPAQVGLPQDLVRIELLPQPSSLAPTIELRNAQGQVVPAKVSTLSSQLIVVEPNPPLAAGESFTVTYAATAAASACGALRTTPGAWTDGGVDDAGAPLMRFEESGSYRVRAGTRPAGLGPLEYVLDPARNSRELRLAQPTSALGAYASVLRYSLTVDDKMVSRRYATPSFDLSTACYRYPSTCSSPEVTAGVHSMQIRGYLPGQTPDETTDVLLSDVLVMDLCSADGGIPGPALSSAPAASDGQIGGGACSTVPGTPALPIGSLVASALSALAMLRRRQRQA